MCAHSLDFQDLELLPIRMPQLLQVVCIRIHSCQVLVSERGLCCRARLQQLPDLLAV
jgi:hypothetical protein